MYICVRACSCAHVKSPDLKYIMSSVFVIQIVQVLFVCFSLGQVNMYLATKRYIIPVLTPSLIRTILSTYDARQNNEYRKNNTDKQSCKKQFVFNYLAVVTLKKFHFKQFNLRLSFFSTLILQCQNQSVLLGKTIINQVSTTNLKTTIIFSPVGYPMPFNFKFSHFNFFFFQFEYLFHTLNSVKY